MGFVLLHLSCQLLLLVPGVSGLRVMVRMAAFATSLIFLVIVPAGRPWQMPLRTCASCILGLLGLEFFHPEGSSLLASFASVMLNLAVLAPIFWLPRTGTSAINLRQLVTFLWLFYALSAVLGVLQAYFPGRFQPPLSAVIAANGRSTLAAFQIKLASGEHVFRPMGLTDSPGGAAFAGLYAVLFGTGMILSPERPFWGARVVAAGGMIAGMMDLYLCQIRSLLVMTGVCIVTLLVLLLVTGRISRLIGLLGAAGVIVPSAFALAFAIGGKSMTDRLTTLVDKDPGAVYYANRGRFFEALINHYLPLYPLGAGLGRWGMVHSYFGSAADSLWVEIQWTAWLFDGGVPMILLYVMAILLSSWACLRVALGKVGRSEPSLSLWGAVLVAYNVGALAVCFNYPLFAGTGGVEFWILNMALLCAAHNTDGALRSPA
jgi:hypothetical protein